MAAVNRSLWAAAAVVGILALVLAWLLVRHFTGPLRRLEGAVTRVAQGDLAARVEVPADDELGRLSRSFNAMAESLERAEQAKRQLIADVAHELRTPIAVLRTAVEGFEDGILEPTPENLSALKDRLHLTARLIDDLQQLALADAGQLTLRTERVPLGELIEGIAALIHPQLEDSGISLSLDLPPGLPPVRGDRGRIEQVLLNLLSNAIRHTPPGGRIDIELHPRGSEVEVVVADTGPGIPPGDEERIFERFYRGPGAVGTPGAGLGLAVAKAIVEAHGGRIWAENRPEGGAALRFTLPLDGPSAAG
ncbi:MAG: ATP-binding protein [Candidatus Bipolaricaulota bacterium]|nr:ATP-binding protein [Candidatus Bipolaricaulota bacterium]